VTEILQALEDRFPGEVVDARMSGGTPSVLVRGGAVRAVLRWLRDEAPRRFEFLADVSGQDGLEIRERRREDPAFAAGTGPWPDRFQVVYQLRSLSGAGRIRVKASVPEDPAEIDTVSDLWAAANWAEREVYDMYGVRFRGHPNLKRILCVHTFKGHALRKDYDIKDQQWLDEDNESLLDELGEFGENPADGGFSELIPVNLGPSHPATHGVLRSLLKLDGEIIVRSVQEIGYLHRGFEKHSETSSWTQVIPYTDRLNYCSAMLNNVAYCRAVENLLGIEVPPRTKFIRIIISEISRVIDHLVCIAACLVDLGALTNFWYLFALREKAYEALEGLCGARLTSSYVRIGGVADDLDALFIGRVRAWLVEMPSALNDVLGLVGRNRIFLDRVKGVGVLGREEALSHGFTGPCLRATGVAYDLRRGEPYDGYETFDFEVATRPDGDTWSRLMVRFDEIKQSMRIIEQALDRLPAGPVLTDDKRVMMPKKELVYENIEALMNHFVLIYDGIKVPAGETYVATEGANGELGFHLVSDGSGRPYRVRCRPPCFYIYSGFARMIEGCMVADAIAVLGSLNVIAGELDR
jgi:NADH-quinone oxidoreductase subunit C/D